MRTGRPGDLPGAGGVINAQSSIARLVWFPNSEPAMRFLPLLSLLATLAACNEVGAPLGPVPPADAGLSEYLLDTEIINESSGLARSQKRDDVLWTLNDSGGATELYAITTEGRHIGTLAITGAPANADWEDLASYSRDGVQYLLIGDIGDNSAFRPFITFYRVREPELADGGSVQALSAMPEAVYNMAYPDGPRDNESLAVDAVENSAYLVSKRDAMPMLYRFSLAASTPLAVPGLMENLGAINIPRAPADFVGDPNSFNWTTAMDFDDSLRRAYVGTLSKGYFWDRSESETWAQAFARAPSGFDLPDYPQIEAGTFLRGRSDAVFITSEQLPARLARIAP